MVPPPHPLSPLETIGAGLALYRRAFWPAVAVVLVLTATVALAVGGALAVLSEVAWAQRGEIFANGLITDHGVVRLALQVGLPAAVVVAAVSAAGFGALAMVLDAVRLERPAHVGRALLGGLRRMPVTVAAAALAALLVVVALLLAPVVSLAAVAWLVVLGVRRLRGATTEHGMSGWRAAWMITPGAAAAVVAARLLLVLPVAATGRGGPVDVLRRSNALVRGRGVRVTVVGLVGVVLYAGTQLVVVAVAALGLAPELVGLALALVQTAAAALPLALLVEARGRLAGRESSAHPAAPRVSAQPAAAAIASVLALTLVAGLLTTAPTAAFAEELPEVEEFEPAPDKFAEEEPHEQITALREGEGGEGEGSGGPLGLVVDDLGDASDAVPGDGVCATGGGVCTMRAAIEEISAVPLVGVSSIEVASAQIAAGTVLLGAPLRVTQPVSIRGDFEGAGRLTLDAAGAGRVFVVDVARAGGLSLSGLELTRGSASDGGGAVLVENGSVMIDRSRLTHHATVSGGSAVHLRGGEALASASISRTDLVGNDIPACATPVDYQLQVFSDSTIDRDDVSCGAAVLPAEGSVATTTTVTLGPVAPLRGAPVTYTVVVARASASATPLDGTVTLREVGGAVLAADLAVVALDADRVSATAAVIAPTAATATIRAEFTAASGYRNSTGDLALTLEGAEAHLSLTADVASAHRGTPVTLTATVTSAVPGLVPEGTVEFVDDDGVLASIELIDGVATLPATATRGDGQQISGVNWWAVFASYSGDDLHPARDDRVLVALEPDRMTVEVDVPAAGAAPGETLTFTARVRSTEPDGAIPTSGSVQFTATPGHGVPVASSGWIPLDAWGETTFSTDALPFGSSTITATYSGTVRFGAASGSADYAVTGALASAVRVVPLSAATLAPGDELRFAISVDAPGAPDGSPAPTGFARVSLEGTVLATVDLADAVVSTTSLAAGTHELRIEYLGDDRYRASETTHTQHVVKVATSTFLTVAPSSVAGEPVSVTALVNGTGGDRPTSGVVEVRSAGDLVATIDLAASSTATALLPVSVGAHALRATFVGTARHAASSSAEVTHTQALADVVVTATLSVDDVPVTEAIVLLIDAVAAAPSALPVRAAGAFVATVGGVEVARVTPSTSGATRLEVDAETLGAGHHAVTVTLVGHPGFTSGSTTVIVTVLPHAPEVALKVAQVTVAGTPSLRLTARVTLPWAPPVGGPRALGRVDFLVDGVVDASESLDDDWREVTVTLPLDGTWIGDHVIRAAYLPPVSGYYADRFTSSSSVVETFSYAGIPTRIAVGGLVLAADASVSRTIAVREDPDGPVDRLPTGTVEAWLNGASLGQVSLTTSTEVAAGIGDVTLPALAVGIHSLTVRYTPEPGSPHAPAEVELEIVAVGDEPVVTLSTAADAVVWGELLAVTAGLELPEDAPGARGTIRVTDAAGSVECSVAVTPATPSGTCHLSWPDAGPRTLTAHFEPAAEEPLYTASSTTRLVTVERVTSVITAQVGRLDGAIAGPSAGDVVTVAWSMATGPAAGVRIEVDAAGYVPGQHLLTCDSGANGSCSVRLSSAMAAGGSVTMRVVADADSRYTAASWEGSIATRACVPVDLAADPVGAGTLTPSLAPNCGGGTGYAAGTHLQFTATPAASGDPGFTWELAGVETASGGSALLVGVGADWARADFRRASACTLVELRAAVVTGTTGSIQRPSTLPNCPDLPEGAVPGWQTASFADGNRVYTVTRAWFLSGTPLVPVLRRGNAETRLYEVTSSVWSRGDLDAGAPRPVAGTYQSLSVVFGPTCHPAAVAADGPGGVWVLNRPNCDDPTGSGQGWFAGTLLDVLVTPYRDRVAFVNGWTGATPREGEIDSAVRAAFHRHGRSDFWDRYTGLSQYASVAVTPAAPVDIRVAFGECHRFTVAGGRVSGGLDAGEARVLTAPNCPVDQPNGMRFYVAGTEVALEAVPPVLTEGSRQIPTFFSGWRRDGVARLIPGQRLTVTLDAPVRVQPFFHQYQDCATVMLQSQTPGVSVAATTHDFLDYCQRGELAIPSRWTLGSVPTPRTADEPAYGHVILEAIPDAGLDPLLGWSFSVKTWRHGDREYFADGSWTTTTSRTQWASDSVAAPQVQVPLGFLSLSAKAHACQGLEVANRVQREDGTWIEDYTPVDEDLVLVWPAPNCPFSPNAWTVGTTVEVWALAHPDGYRFHGWTGDLDGAVVGEVAGAGLRDVLGADADDLFGPDLRDDAVLTIPMTGETPVRRISPEFEVICHDVTVGGFAGSTTWYPEPNCPGFEGEVTYEHFPDSELRRIYYGTKTDIAEMRESYGPRSMTGRFIGGTEILLRAEGRSGMVWTGWRGDVVQEGRVNPGAAIVADRDLHIENTYRDKSTAEQLESFGNDIAIGIKKGVGFAATITAEYLKYYPPLGAVASIADGISAVGSLLELLGVSPDDTQWLHLAKQLINLPFALIGCGGEWGLGSGDGVATAAGIAAANLAKNQTYRITNIRDASHQVAEALSEFHSGERGMWMKTKLAYYRGKLGLSKLAPKGSLVMTAGLAVVNGVTTGAGISWDSDAATAWSSGDLYVDCLRNSVPEGVRTIIGAAG